MGHWIGRENQRFYIEGGVVLSGPGGKPLPINPVTFEVLPEIPAAPVVQESATGTAGLSDFTDEAKIETFLKEGKNSAGPHAKNCKSMGRGGRYTDGCPKCEELKAK